MSASSEEKQSEGSVQHIPSLSAIEEQAGELEILLPRMMRWMFAIGPNNPANELTIAQLRVCTLLQDGPYSLTSVARELTISTSAATQIADRLERIGLVERIAQAEDRRAKHLLLTPHGKAVMRARRQDRIRRVQCILAHIPEQERPMLLHAVEMLLDAAKIVPVPGAEGEEDNLN